MQQYIATALNFVETALTKILLGIAAKLMFDNCQSLDKSTRTFVNTDLLVGFMLT